MKSVHTGMTVLYRLNEFDVAYIKEVLDEKRGNYNVAAGDVYPLLVCRVWPMEFGPGRDGVNGQLFLDGCDSIWLTSRGEGAVDGTWRFQD